jgi:hypothetical protein
MSDILNAMAGTKYHDKIYVREVLCSLADTCGSSGIAHQMEPLSAVFTVPSNVSLRRMQGLPSLNPTHKMPRHCFPLRWMPLSLACAR